MKLESIVLMVVMVAFAETAYSQTEILTFDDLSWSGNYYEQMPNGYGGLLWNNNFGVVNTVEESAQYGDSGDINGVMSAPNVAYSSGGDALISDGRFNLNSAYLMGVLNDGLQVEVQGLVGIRLMYDNTYTIGTQGSTLINFNYIGVDEVIFNSFGGVPHGFSRGAGTEFAMDNLSITLVPEPSALQLAGLATMSLTLGGLTRGWSQRRLSPQFRPRHELENHIFTAALAASRRGSSLER